MSLNFSENQTQILGYFLKFAKTEHQDEIEKHTLFRSFGDLTKPHLDYPLAREMKVSTDSTFFLVLVLFLFFHLRGSCKKAQDHLQPWPNKQREDSRCH